ncbi:MAG TPA: PorV/PorQ family protein [Candidatus Kapabacteria bacterium]|nr:PorV/PorQ family protein [Candidatus Kapabacteria bacterium]
MIINKLNILYKLSFVVIAFILLLPNDNFAQSFGAGYSSSYLNRNNGARAIGMAGAYTAIANEPSAIFYNPAGIGYLDEIPLVNSSISILGLGRVNSSLSWAQEVSPSFGVGASFNSFYGGSFTARDVKGNPLGTMNDFQYSLALAGAYKIEFMSMGASLKYLGSSLGSSSLSASGVSLDLGTKFDVFDLFSFGLSIQNVSGMLFWNNEASSRDDIPYTIRTGVAFEYGLNDDLFTTRSTITGKEETVYIPATRYILFSADMIFNQYVASPDFVIGTEISPHELIALRGGISIYGEKLGTPQLFPMNYWGGGISIRPDLKDLPFKMNIDYSIANEYLLNNGIAHHVSLLFEF